MRQKLFIKNQRGEKIAVVVERSDKDRCLAFIAHGLGGFKEQLHIKAFNRALRAAGCTTVRWDARDSIGESEGKIEKATFNSYWEDLKEVIGWARKQPWFSQRFILVGHSLGSAAILLYAENHPDEVKLLAPTSAVVSGQLFVKDYQPKEELAGWQKKGFILKESTSKPGVIKKISWQMIESLQSYDALNKAEKLTMPVLLMVGDQDPTTPLSHQQILFKALPSPNKELHVIKGAAHTFRHPSHLKKIQKIMQEWAERHLS